MPKNAPATPLPWASDEWEEGRFYSDREMQDRRYRAHAANAYPRLVGALRDLQTAIADWRDSGRPDLGRLAKAEDAAADALREFGEV